MQAGIGIPNLNSNNTYYYIDVEYWLAAKKRNRSEDN